MPFLLLMPSYNQSHYMVETIRSVLAQDDPDWELWIVDNSTDNTPVVMGQFADARIHFHHISARMDPGSCLNWMLERAVGRDFSYVHTDNNLRPSYVRRMRAALANHPHALAYCDMRVIDKDGAYTNVYRRGSFDLARLLSCDTLGVPFAATTELAKQVGGFSVRDFADDVRFCIEAYGVAEYVYLPQPLLDYRLHGTSRTQEAGGHDQMQRLFIALMPKIVPVLERRGIRPLEVLTQAIHQALDDLDLYVEDLWHHKLSKWVAPWWQGIPRLDHFFFSGLINVPGFSPKFGRPSLWRWMRRHDRRGGVPFWKALLLRAYFLMRKRHLRRLFKKPRSMLFTWATMALDETSHETVSVRVCSLDFRTLWVARQLEIALGWKPLLDVAAEDIPTWLSWSRASGTEPLLDCSTTITLTRRVGELK